MTSDTWSALSPVPLRARSVLSVALLSLVLVELVVRRRPVGPAAPLAGAVCLALLIPALYGAPSEYASDKIARLLIEMPFILLIPAGVLYDRQQIRNFVIAVGYIGFGLALYSLAAAEATDWLGLRLTIAGRNPIAFGRLLGLATLGWLHLRVTSGRQLAHLAPAVVCTVALIRTASRGPLLALAVAGVVHFLISSSTSTKTSVSSISGVIRIIVLAICGNVWLQRSSFVDTIQFERIAGARPGIAALSDISRGRLFSAAWSEIDGKPLGHGWGYFRSLGLQSFGTPFTYPHNLLLELWLEAGPFIASFIVVVVWAALFKATRSKDAIISAVIVYLLINAMVSGDISSNMLLVAVSTWTFVLAKRAKAAGTPLQSVVADAPHLVRSRG